MPILGSKGETIYSGLRVQLVGDAPEHRAAVKNALAAITEPRLEVVESETRLPRPGGETPDVTMVMFNGNEEAAIAYLEAQAAQSPRPAMFALLSGRSPVLMKRLLRAGADELLFLPLDPADTARALLKISEARWRTERREGGVVCSVTSVVGGVGVTTVTANLGLAFRVVLDRRVALLDLDHQAGGLAIYLNLEPEMTILPLSRLERKLDSIQLESALTKHPSGLYMLAAPKRIEEAELISDLTVGMVLDLMRQLFDFVIVDCGDHVDENTVAAWERSDHLFYILQQSVSAARSAWRFVDLFERLGLGSLQPQYILNRWRPSHPIGEKQLESTLGHPLFARLPADERTLERVEISGEHLWQVAPHSHFARALEALARRIVPQPQGEAAAPAAGFMARLRSALGAAS